LADIQLRKHRNGFTRLGVSVTYFSVMLYYSLQLMQHIPVTASVAVNRFVIIHLTDISVTVKVNLNHTPHELKLNPRPQDALSESDQI